MNELRVPLDFAKTSASHNQRVQLKVFNCFTQLFSRITPVQFRHNGHLHPITSDTFRGCLGTIYFEILDCGFYLSILIL